jgi:hypothetical protein
MKTLLAIATVLAGSLLLASCDRETCGTDFFENRSSATVYLCSADSTWVVPVEAGHSLTFQPFCGLGVGRQPRLIYEHRFVRNAEKRCKKNIQDGRNWNTIQLEKYRWEYHFTVTDADF